MSSSDLSSRAKLNYDSDKFTVEFNVAEYSPEVSKLQFEFSDSLTFTFDSYLTLHNPDTRTCISKQKETF